MAAAMLDVLWTPLSYERLVGNWGFDMGTATQAVIWAVDVVVQAIRDDVRPAHGTLQSRRRAAPTRTGKRRK
jgi:hypothetical protein